MAVIVRRDTREKITAAIEELPQKIAEVLEQEQHDMLERARAHRDAHTYEATEKEEFKKIADEKPGFIKAMWCGCQECEDAIKEEFGAQLAEYRWKIFLIMHLKAQRIIFILR